MRSAKAPVISAGVMIAKVIWNITNTDSGIVKATGADEASTQREGRAHIHAGHQHAGEVAEIGVPVAEGDAVPDNDPKYRDQTGDREALHHGGQQVHLADHAAVEQGQTRNGHHQDQGGRGQHPGGIARVDFRDFGLGQRAGRQGDRPQYRRKQRNSEGKQTAHYGQILSNQYDAARLIAAIGRHGADRGLIL